MHELTGRVFGRLTVHSLSDKRTEMGRYWLCECECGVFVQASASRLITGRKQSCGCLIKDRTGETHRVDIAGKVFGRLTAVECAGNTNGRYVWRCVCECGAERVHPVGRLTSGEVVSCGCAANVLTPYRSIAMRAKKAVYRLAYMARKRNAEGSFTAAEVAELYERQVGRCNCCACELNGVFERDHILALNLGGSNYISNIQLLCRSCNARKSDFHPDEFAKRERVAI